MKKEYLKIKISDLKKNPINPKKHNNELIESSIKELGFVDDIVVDENNMILSGHGRLDALKNLNYTEVNVIKISGWTEKQKQKYGLLANKSVESGGWDNEMLSNYDEDILGEAGFNEYELNEIFDLDLTKEDAVVDFENKENNMILNFENCKEMDKAEEEIREVLKKHNIKYKISC